MGHPVISEQVNNLCVGAIRDFYRWRARRISRTLEVLCLLVDVSPGGSKIVDSIEHPARSQIFHIALENLNPSPLTRVTDKSVRLKY